MASSFLTKRKLLFVMLAFLVSANIVWLYIRCHQNEADFKLEATNFSMEIHEANFAKIPLFQGRDIGWSLDGSKLESLKPFVVENADQHTRTGSFVIIRLPEEASTQLYREALEALLDQGICYTGVVDVSDQSERGPFYDAAIHKIVNVRNTKGQLSECVDLFTPVSIRSD